MRHSGSAHRLHSHSAMIAVLLLPIAVLLLAGCGSPPWTNVSGNRFNSSNGPSIGGLIFDSKHDVLFKGYRNSVWRCVKPETSASWASSALGPNSVSCIAYDPTRDILYAATTTVMGQEGGGVWRCSNATTSPSWSNGPMGLSSERVYCLTYDPTHNVLYAGASGTGLWSCTVPDTSASWVSAGGDFNGTAVDTIAYDSSRDIIYVGTPGIGVMLCTNPRTSPAWTDISGELISRGRNGISSLVYDYGHNVLYAGTYQAGGIVNKENGGVWRCPAPGGSPSWMGSGALGSHYVSSLAFDSDRDVLYAGTNSDGVWRCTNPRTSASWTNTGGKLTSFEITDLAFDSTHDLLYANARYRSEPPRGNQVWRYKP